MHVFGSAVSIRAIISVPTKPCCTLFNNDGYWYRAEVVGLPSSDISEVLYVDYGNTGRVSLAIAQHVCCLVHDMHIFCTCTGYSRCDCVVWLGESPLVAGSYYIFTKT